jgi:hypothetical protein
VSTPVDLRLGRYVVTRLEPSPGRQATLKRQRHTLGATRSLSSGLAGCVMRAMQAIVNPPTLLGPADVVVPCDRALPSVAPERSAVVNVRQHLNTSAHCSNHGRTERPRAWIGWSPSHGGSQCVSRETSGRLSDFHSERGVPFLTDRRVLPRRGGGAESPRPTVGEPGFETLPR